jgi:two-component system, cell cycle sensor histidine kinase and response regulator CckA
MENMERAKGLTQQLLTFAKGGMPIKKPTSIATLVKETAAFALSGSNVKCDYRIPEDLWHCSVDRNQIGQVIQNLMINAIQAMPLGGIIAVTATNVSLREREHPTLGKGHYVSISIKDQGIGISKDMLQKIFDPFFTTKEKGHGLGLAISYSIVKKHDGAINVYSELGKGSVFHVYLPASVEADTEGTTTPIARHTGSGRILVMDDEEAVRDLIAEMLRSFGYSVICKDNGEETIGFFKREWGTADPIRGMILDLTIPGGMGGRDVAAEIRKLDKDVRLFVASGYADDPVMAKPREHGFTGSISKPFNVAELMELLERHMGGQEGK